MDLSRYLGLFVTDAREHLAGLEADAVRLEEAASDERKALLDGIFRHLHSLKSSSATMGLEPIAKLSHLAEGMVERLRAAGAAIGAERIDLLLETTDELRALVDLAAEGKPLAPRPLLAERLARASEGAAPAPQPTSRPPSPLVRPDVPHTVACVRVSARSATPAARAFLALRKLEQLGRVLASDPTLEQLREGKLPHHTLTAVLAGEHSSDALRLAVARVPDLEGVELRALPDAPAAEAPPDAPAAEPRAAVAAEQTIRVKVDLLDQLLELAGELLLSSARMREGVRHVGDERRAPLEEEVDRLRRLVKDLNNRVLATRQTPVQHLAERLPRAVRDLSRKLGKPLSLQVEGADVTLDRGLLEALVDPLLHALRNAADHGIEAPEERQAKGKPAAGKITFAARRERDRVMLELRDDGRGFDVARLREKAVRAGALTREEAEALSDAQALRLAFLPGVSTREVSTDVSGRGVGMDAVLRAVEQLGGAVSVDSSPGQGSCVRFALPATVSVVNLLLVALGSEIFGVPMSRVLHAVEADLAARSIQVGGEKVAGYALGKLLGLSEETTSGARPFVVVEGEGQRTAVGVDRVLGQEEVVLRPLSPPLERIRGLAGTAILGSGRPIFVLDVPRLVA